MLHRVNTWIGVAGCVFGTIGLLALFCLDAFPYRLSQAQELSFERTHFATIASLTAGLVCGVGALCLDCRRHYRSPHYAAWGSIALSVLGLGLLRFDADNLGIHSSPSVLNICINNQRSIDAAKEDYALHKGITTGADVTWDEISVDFLHGIPKCPEGGNYELGKVGEAVTCSVVSHNTSAR